MKAGTAGAVAPKDAAAVAPQDAAVDPQDGVGAVAPKDAAGILGSLAELVSASEVEP
jgi:hypothetical protein